MIHDKNGLEVLSREESLRLLSSVRVGRLALSLGALPVIFPVNFGVIDESVMVRSGTGTKLDAALAGAVVAFEADDVGQWTHVGWSVMVQGIAVVVAAPNEVERAAALELRPWVLGEQDRYIKIGTQLLSGRRLPVPMVSSHAGH